VVISRPGKRGSSQAPKKEKILPFVVRKLTEERAQLERDLQEANAAVSAAADIATPYKNAFWEAHRRAGSLSVNGEPGYDRASRKVAYDARMWAGVEWHPHKQRLKEEERWSYPFRA
jgi:hypothetical protein